MFILNYSSQKLEMNLLSKMLTRNTSMEIRMEKFNPNYSQEHKCWILLCRLIISHTPVVLFLKV